MININVRFQLAAMCIWLLMIIDYNRNKHLKLLSSICFRSLLICTGLNLVFDLATVYSIQYCERMPELNRIFHQFFIFSVVAIIFTQFLYIEILSNNQKRLRSRFLISSIVPILISVPVILFGDITYVVTDSYCYSYGSMVYTIFFCGLIYLIMCFYLTIRKSSDLSRYQRGSIQIGLFIWGVTLATQCVIKGILISGIGAVLMVLSVYFSFENQKENFDAQTHCFNRNAFHRMAGEYVEREKKVFLLSFTYDNYNQVNSIVGHDLGAVGLRKLRAIITAHFQTDVFHSRTNTFSIFTRTEPDFDTIHTIEREIAAIDLKGFQMRCYITMINLRTYVKKEDDVYDYLSFLMLDLHERKAESGLYFLTADMVERKRNYDELERIIAHAIEEKGFEMYYQPIYSTQDQEFHSAEALIRFQRNERDEYVSPEDFIPVAEQMGMIIELGDLVFEMTARDIRTENMEALGIRFIEVNLSRMQTVSSDIANHLKMIISKYNVAPEFINVEITETAAIYSMESMYHNIRQLQEAGFSLSMDDFGTGFANMDQLNEVSYQVIKLDKSLIWPVFDQSSDQQTRHTAENVLSAAINMMKSLNVKIVAEGIETSEMVDYLTAHGVDYLQGYYFSKPLNRTDFITFLKENNQERKEA